VAAFVCLLALPLWAQSPSDQDLLSLNLEQLAHIKVYSASRHMEDAREAPSVVSIVTAERHPPLWLAHPRGSPAQPARLLHRQ